jgi:beta-glucosidase
MHTETNLDEGPRGDEAEHWLWKQWANVLRVRNDGVPVRGLHLVFADRPGGLGHRAAREAGNVNPLGLYDLDREIRAVGRSYKQLIA